MNFKEEVSFVVPIFDLFSKRQRVLEGKVTDVFTYDEIPRQLRMQILYIVADALGHDNGSGNESGEVYDAIHGLLCREYGLPTLGGPSVVHENCENRLRQFVGTATTSEVLDAVEACFRAIDNFARRQNAAYYLGSVMTADEAISELNERFRWHGVGYQFESGRIVRVDSQFLHSSAIKPALSLLHDKRYAGANSEFLKAFEDYRKGDTKGCLNECLKAREHSKDDLYNPSVEISAKRHG